MRIWDLSPDSLCRQHLLAEHRELHAIWNILTLDKKRYRHHPEVRRWQGKLRALYDRHESLTREMSSRGYRHLSPLDDQQATGTARQDVLLDSIEEQQRILRRKRCGCNV